MAADIADVQVVFLDNDGGPGSIGNSLAVIVVTVPTVVVDYDGAIPPAQRGPAVVIVVPEPGDPGGGPAVTGDPVPSESSVPIPTAVMVSVPTPVVIRAPDISVVGIPYPAAIVVGTPGATDVVGDPDIGVEIAAVSPSAITG